MSAFCLRLYGIKACCACEYAFFRLNVSLVFTFYRSIISAVEFIRAAIVFSGSTPCLLDRDADNLLRCLKEKSVQDTWGIVQRMISDGALSLEPSQQDRFNILVQVLAFFKATDLDIYGMSVAILLSDFISERSFLSYLDSIIEHASANPSGKYHNCSSDNLLCKMIIVAIFIDGLCLGKKPRAIKAILNYQPVKTYNDFQETENVANFLKLAIGWRRVDDQDMQGFMTEFFDSYNADSKFKTVLNKFRPDKLLGGEFRGKSTLSGLHQSLMNALRKLYSLKDTTTLEEFGMQTGLKSDSNEFIDLIPSCLFLALSKTSTKGIVIPYPHDLLGFLLLASSLESLVHQSDSPTMV
jgi:hypothetical protein